MKKLIGVAVALGLLSAGTFATSYAAGPCGTGQIIDWDGNGFAWETPANPVNNVSPAGNQLTCVGLVTLFCSPFTDLDPADPSTEYTFVLSGLSNALATNVQVFGTTTIWTTNYGSGVFSVYAGSPRNAPSELAMPINPPNATVPANYQDGTAILSGTLANFSVQITKTGSNPANGSFRSDYEFTGGTLFSRVSGTGTGLLSGLWSVNSLPTGYSAHPDGKFDNPPTATRGSTWGMIKQLYR
ncbi:MAG TPA: hypothetical protein VL332_04260 [Candidatus Saccharimonadaceae bacterium]|jgi:hypothetical protein|nr:hypothetical protein [Candidatus Saccharimonadaceae bacterium]